MYDVRLEEGTNGVNLPDSYFAFKKSYPPIQQINGLTKKVILESLGRKGIKHSDFKETFFGVSRIRYFNFMEQGSHPGTEVLRTIEQQLGFRNGYLVSLAETK